MSKLEQISIPVHIPEEVQETPSKVAENVQELAKAWEESVAVGTGAVLVSANEVGEVDVKHVPQELQAKIDEQAEKIRASAKAMGEQNIFEDMKNLKEVPLPPIELDAIRNMFPVPKCTIKHAYHLMKVSSVLEDLAIGLYYACPHNVHLQRALLELQLVHEAANKAVQSE